MNGDGGGRKHPVAGAGKSEGNGQAGRDGWDCGLLGYSKATILECAEVAIARAPGFGKNDKAGAAVDGVLREPPHALEIGRTANVGNGNIAETFHEPAVGGNLEVGFEFPATHELRDHA